MPYYKAFLQSDDCLIAEVFNFKYEIGKIYKHDGDIKIGSRGFHFCRTPKDCYNYYYRKNPKVVICEVEPIGKLLWDGDDKICTNIIKIGRMLSKKEIEKCYSKHLEKHFGKWVTFENGIPKGEYYLIDSKGTEYWFKDGKYHRDEIDPETKLSLPAIITNKGIQLWYKDGVIHRDEIDPDTGKPLPAVINQVNGKVKFFKHGNKFVPK